ncbi:hypothetical protein CBG59_06790 [Fusobacterium polymorphum]|uniref:Uncharacterized protein n=1 Tax=Fusobacterium nucleatum subsp. polymorphum TaxID=76857 RepID=A0A2C6CAH7_FUSNP|nr:hypothetical protein CBG59_06790 [Fusobacterium polymorphum]
MWLIKAHTSQEAPTSTSGSSSLYDFWKKKITKKDFIIYFSYFFIDITLIYLIIILILRNFPTV